MSIRFTATVYRTTHLADFIDHDKKVDTSRRDELPIGTPVAIDAKGEVFIPGPLMPLDLLKESKIAFPVRGTPRPLFRDYWRYAGININTPDKAGPYFHAVLNALNWGK